MLDDVLRHHAIDRNDLYSVANFLARTRSRLLASPGDSARGGRSANIPGTIESIRTGGAASGAD